MPEIRYPRINTEIVRNHIRRYGAQAPGYLDEMFEKKFKPVTINLPRPEKFRDVPDEKIRVLGYPNATAYRELKSEIVNDPDSITGKTLIFRGKDASWHGVGKMIQATPAVRVPAMKFALANIGAKGEVSTVLQKVPQDEKYHWYKLKGTIDLHEKSYFWGHSWAIQFKTDSVYVLSDGIADNNVWECWMSAKFTGPAYVKGSRRRNDILVERAVFVKD